MKCDQHFPINFTGTVQKKYNNFTFEKEEAGEQKCAFTQNCKLPNSVGSVAGLGCGL